jgi:hypothetical protein
MGNKGSSNTKIKPVTSPSIPIISKSGIPNTTNSPNNRLLERIDNVFLGGNNNYVAINNSDTNEKRL